MVRPVTSPPDPLSNKYNIPKQINYFIGEGELIERWLRPLSLCTPLLENGDFKSLSIFYNRQRRPHPNTEILRCAQNDKNVNNRLIR
jgi:hypothetical protein